MRRLLVLIFGLLLVAAVLAPAASAQYLTPPGNGPTVGGTDNGVVTNETPNNTPPVGSTGPPTEVKGKQFARDISNTSSGFQLFWLWLLLALALGLAFLILWRRRRDEGEDFAGAQPA